MVDQEAMFDDQEAMFDDQEAMLDDQEAMFDDKEAMFDDQEAMCVPMHFKVTATARFGCDNKLPEDYDEPTS